MLHSEEHRAVGSLPARAAGALSAAASLWSPWRDLAARLFLAQGFVMADAAWMMHGGLSLKQAPASLLASLAASDLGGALALLAPLLLAAGLFSRVAAAAMLAQLALLPWSAPGVPVFWAALLAWVVVRGPGRLSIDAMLTPTLRGSALPASVAIGRFYGWLTRHAAPLFLALLRVGVAVSLVGHALEAAGISLAMAPGRTLAWLPSPPDTPGLPGPAAALVLAALLAAGLLTRVIAVGLIATIPMAGLMAGDQRVFWALLLALLFVEGPGVPSVDAWLARALRRAFPRVGDLPPEALARLPHVVVVGGGFAGLAAVQALASAPCRLTLIDRRNFTLFQPLLYQVATAGLSPADIATPIRAIFRHHANVRVLLGEVTSVEPARRTVLLERDEIAYDTLVLATGARHAYFGRDDWAPFAPGLKQVEDATDIRRRLLSAFEMAERSRDPDERAAWLTFVVVGGGPTGVELAGAIAELSHQSLSDEFRAADPSLSRVLLVQAEDRVLPTFPPALSAHAARSLGALGVELLTGRRVTGIDADGVMVDGERIAARSVLWAAGVMASPAGSWVGARVDRAGRALVGPDLSVPGHPEIFVIGDTASSDAWRGKPVPGLAPAAKQGGAYAARVIRARLAGRQAPRAFRYRHQGSLATVGRQSAIADFGWLRLHGVVAWWLWGAVHLLFLIGGRNRATVLIEWLWAYLTYHRGTRLITGTPHR